VELVPARRCAPGDAAGARLQDRAIAARETKAFVEAVLAARSRGDWDALFAELHPDAEWEPIAESVVYRGREAIAGYFEKEVRLIEVGVEMRPLVRSVAPEESRPLPARLSRDQAAAVANAYSTDR
jgi:ketosteroid isomerase-like protein